MMTNLLKKTVLGGVLAATTLTAAAPAEARSYYYGHDRGDTAGAAIAGGIVGLALGALIGSSSHDRGYDRYDRHYRNDRYDYRYQYRDGRYYDRDGSRYDRNWQSRDGYYRGW